MQLQQAASTSHDMDTYATATTASTATASYPTNYSCHHEASKRAPRLAMSFLTFDKTKMKKKRRKEEKEEEPETFWSKPTYAISQLLGLQKRFISY